MRLRTSLWRCLQFGLVIVGGLALLGMWQNQSGGMTFDLSKPHHTKSGFVNNHPHDEHGFLKLMRWVRERRSIEVVEERLPVETVAPEVLTQPPLFQSVTWVGHSTFLLRLNGLTILTDPHFTGRASPVSWAGPERVTQPAIEIDQLPVIDVVLISHNHYDHLDRESVRKLVRRSKEKQPLFLVPLGLTKLLQRWGARRVVELDWWQPYLDFAGWSFQPTPVQHFSARTPFDRNQSLWAGWRVDGPPGSFYFAGDTGYSADFAETRNRLGPVDLALIPIGAYEPRWFMESMHLNPEDAAQVHLDLEARQSVGMHWGTFILTDEPMDEPPKRLASACRSLGIEASQFRVLRHGESLKLDAVLGQSPDQGSAEERPHSEADDEGFGESRPG